MPLDFDLVVTAQQVRSYKPDPAHFNECARRIGGKKGWVHVAASYYHDIEPCVKAKIPVIWVNRHKETLEPASASRPPRSRTCARRRSSSASPSVGRRAPSRCGASPVHADVIVLRSRSGRRRARWCAAGEEGFVIDSPVFPDELEVLAGVLEQAGFPVCGLLATHGDWDHLLGRLAFPEARSASGEHRAAARARPRRRPSASCATSTRSTTSTTARRWRSAGSSAAGARRLRLGRRASSSSTRPTATRPTGWRSGSPGLGVLVCGDYLSPVEIPTISPGGRSTPTWRRSSASSRSSRAAEHVVPGHGGPLERAPRGRCSTRTALPAGAVGEGADAAAAPGRRTGRATPHPRRECRTTLSGWFPSSLGPPASIPRRTPSALPPT